MAVFLNEKGFIPSLEQVPDPAVEPLRLAFHVRSVENERVGLTGWRPDWKAMRSSYRDPVRCSVEKSALGATLVLRSGAEGLSRLEQRITLRSDSPLAAGGVQYFQFEREHGGLNWIVVELDTESTLTGAVRVEVGK